VRTDVPSDVNVTMAFPQRRPPGVLSLCGDKRGQDKANHERARRC